VQIRSCGSLLLFKSTGIGAPLVEFIASQHTLLDVPWIPTDAFADILLAQLNIPPLRGGRHERHRPLECLQRCSVPCCHTVACILLELDSC